jgi:hypothetical protein
MGVVLSDGEEFAVGVAGMIHEWAHGCFIGWPDGKKHAGYK